MTTPRLRLCCATAEPNEPTADVAARSARYLAYYTVLTALFVLTTLFMLLADQEMNGWWALPSGAVAAVVTLCWLHDAAALARHHYVGVVRPRRAHRRRLRELGRSLDDQFVCAICFEERTMHHVSLARACAVSHVSDRVCRACDEETLRRRQPCAICRQTAL